MRDIDAHSLEISVAILEVTSDLHACRLEEHVAGRSGLVIHTFMTMRLVEAVSLLIANTIDNGGVEQILGPLLDAIGDATHIWGDLDEHFRQRLNEIEKQALALMATGLPGDSPF